MFNKEEKKTLKLNFSNSDKICLLLSLVFTVVLVKSKKLSIVLLKMW